MEFFLICLFIAGVPSIILWHILYKYTEIRKFSFEEFHKSNYTVKNLLVIIILGILPVFNWISLGVGFIMFIISFTDPNMRWTKMINETSKISKFFNKRLN